MPNMRKGELEFNHSSSFLIKSFEQNNNYLIQQLLNYISPLENIYQPTYLSMTSLSYLMNNSCVYAVYIWATLRIIIYVDRLLH